MNTPGYSAEASLYRKNEFHHSYIINVVHDSDNIVPAMRGPLADCACCIFFDKYKCCRDCVEAILDQF